MDKIIEINSAVNGFVWGPIMLALLVGTGIYLSFRVGFIQFSKIGYWWKNTIGKIFQKSEAGEGEITPLQAVSTALASTVGTGNIAGVTGAIILGGPGAVFWMWISALFGMVTKFAEVTLAVKYRERNEKGDWCGGPMYYIKNGLGPKWKWLGVIFSVFGALAAFGIGNISQINSIASSVNSVAVAFHENAKEFDTIIGLITGVVIAIFVALVLLGGVKRIGQVTEKLVPGMAAIYIVCALVVVIANAGTIPGVFASIFQGAFNPSAVVGGAVGVTMKLAITKGVGRGVFSNEAGLGSAPIAHAATSEKNPVRQGLYGIFEVFMDTIVICTLTSLVVLCSGAATGNYGNNDLAGVPTAVAGFASVFGDKLGSLILAVGLLLFATSTILGWALYGTRCAEFLFGSKIIRPYQVLFCLVVIAGSVANLKLVWDISDTLNGLMAIPNLIGILLLSPVDKVGILDKAYMRADQLSGGQQQRVALARTLTQSPHIILADEPVAALDPVTAKQVMQDFVHINQEMGISILLNIHHVELALEYADRIIGIRAGKIVYDGPSARVDQAVLDSIYGEQGGAEECV